MTSWQKSFLLRGGWSFCSIQAFKLLDEAHIMEGYLLYSKSTYLNVNLIQKQLSS